MESLDVAPTSNPTANALIAALLTADAPAIAACFTPQARLRSLNPPGLNERVGNTDIAELMSSWFSNCTDVELVTAFTSNVVDRQHISYRFAGEKEGRGYCLIEQQLYADMDGPLIKDLMLVCSGFRPMG